MKRHALELAIVALITVIVVLVGYGATTDSPARPAARVSLPASPSTKDVRAAFARVAPIERSATPANQYGETLICSTYTDDKNLSDATPAGWLVQFCYIRPATPKTTPTLEG